MASSIQKWGFGMAPLKDKTALHNKKAITAVRNFIAGVGIVIPDSILDDISWVKGMFNRVLRQDQWDWFTVDMMFDYPTNKDLGIIVKGLERIRYSIKNKIELSEDTLIRELHRAHFDHYCKCYLEYDGSDSNADEYLYILSRREEKDILKIGMTTRNVAKRVNEINSATGVLYPFSPRKVYKVKNSAMVEKDVHKLLSEYRIRSDREFFKLDYSKACEIIEEYLNKTKQFYYW